MKELAPVTTDILGSVKRKPNKERNDVDYVKAINKISAARLSVRKTTTPKKILSHGFDGIFAELKLHLLYQKV